MKQIVKRATVAIIVFYGLMMLVGSSNAEYYKWVDQKGNVHFTDDESSIPEEYRDKAKKQTTPEDSMTPEQKKEEQKKEEQTREQVHKEYKRSKQEDRSEADRPAGRCEMISFSLRQSIKDKATCAEIVITNNSRFSQSITETNIVATATQFAEKRSLYGPTTVAPTNYKGILHPRPVQIELRRGETFRGDICFDRFYTIERIELQGIED